MSDLENIDDELLSAYLDDELSPAERSRVEARLASDPAARQLLDGLRAMSQAVHNLPQESLGHDLRDSILRRAEQARRTAKVASAPPTQTSDGASPGTAAQLRQVAPSFTLGRTRRGWVWAAMAITAGLLIAMFVPGLDRNQDSREVALREKLRAEDAEKIATDVPKQRTMDEQPAPAAPLASTMPAAAPVSGDLGQVNKKMDESDAALGGIADRIAISGTADKAMQRLREPLSESAAKSEAPDDRFATNGDEQKATALSTPRATGEPFGAGTMNAPQSGGAHGRKKAVDGDAAEAFARRGSKIQADADQLVTVLVRATPEALQNKAFDKLLDASGVEVETPPVEEQEQLTVNQDGPTASREQQVGQQLTERSPETDMVLVEGPRMNILSCMDKLNKDVENFPGLLVDEAATESETSKPLDDSSDKSKVATETAAASAPVQKQQAKELSLSQYNRGDVSPPYQYGRLNRGQTFGFEAQGGAAAGRAGGFGGGGFRGGLAQPADAKNADDLERSPRKDSSPDNRAKARRVQPEEMSELNNRGLDRKLAKSSRSGVTAGGESSSSVSLKSEGRQAEPKAGAIQDNDQIQLLFIISTGDDAKPPTSPPADNRAK